MQITNEEMEILNRASEILSKYSSQGNITRDDFEHFENMVISIINGISDDSADDKAENLIKNSASHARFPESKYRIDEKLFHRDYIGEKEYGIEEIRLYGYYEDDEEESLCIVGEIIAEKLKKSVVSSARYMIRTMIS